MHFLQETGVAPSSIDPLSEYIKCFEYEKLQQSTDMSLIASWVEKRETLISTFRSMIENATTSTT